MDNLSFVWAALAFGFSPVTNLRPVFVLLYNLQANCCYMDNLRQVRVTQYVTPLREGGSLPAIAGADDGFMYVLKFRGAGQGAKALIAELIGGELARLLGLRVPELVFAQLDEAFGRTEPDEEIQDLLKASTGLNLALHYLSGSITYDPVSATTDAETASRIVWLDSLLMNVDRTNRNTNLLMWNRQLWLIDHGAALYFHHSWQDWEAKIQSPFGMIKDHVLLPLATRLADADAWAQQHITPQAIADIVALIPDEWLVKDTPFATPEEHRQAYVSFLVNRMAHSHTFIKAANDARAALI